MTQKFNRFVSRIGQLGPKILTALLIASTSIRAETLSFNASGDFDNQFTQRAGSGDNRFEEAASIGISGSRAIRRFANGSETVAYTRNTSLGGLLNTVTVSLRFNYSTNSTSSGGEPFFFGITSNANFDGSETGNGADDFLGVELSQGLTGSNESKLTAFNGINGSRTQTVDSGFENLTPGWYEIEISVVQSAGLFDLFADLHRMSSNGSTRTETDVVTAAISSLVNSDLVAASDVFLFIGGTDTLNRGVDAMDEFEFTGFGTAATITAPTGLVANSASHEQINIFWNDNSSNETNFRVQRRQGAGAWNEIAVLPANTESYADSGLALATTYSYRIVATNSEISSNPSNESSATTLAAPVPNVPANMSASAFSMTRIDLTWTDTADNETWFRIERKVGNGAFSQLIDIVGNLESYSDSGLTADTTYTYRIRSGNAAGLSSPSNESAATTPGVPIPSAPANLRLASTSVTQVSLAWDDSSNDEDGFRIERRDGNGEFEQIAELPAGSTAYSDTDVFELGDFTYHVFAYNGNGVSAFSNPVNVLLPFLAPSDLAAQAISSDQVDLSWIDHSGVETGFRIERRVGNGTYITLVNIGNNVSSFSDVTVNPLTSYTYRIFGIRFTTFSESANEASVITPDISAPNAPANLVIASQGLNHVILEWTDTSTNEDGFRVERKTGNGGYETLVELGPTNTTFTDNQVSELQSYAYRMVSYNGGGDSTPSNEVSTVIDFNDPTNLMALAVSSEQIDLTWDDNSIAESGYRVERKTGQGSFEIIATLEADSNNYSDTDVEPLSTYTYRVIGLGNGIESSPTNEFSAATPNIPVPGSADNLVVSLIDASYVVLNWADNSLDETGFRIERMVGSGGWSDYFQVAANVTSFQDLEVGELETFAYRIVAFNEAGVSTPSNESSVFFPFNAPTILTAQASAQSRIDLTWADNSLVETGYRIERKSGEGAFEPHATVDQGISAYVDGTVTVDLAYTYRVVGVYDGGESNPTNEVSAMTSSDTIKPAAPAGLAANAINFDQIHLTWTDTSDNESGFRIERMEGAEGTFAFIGNVSADVTSYTDKNLQPETSYTYRIVSYINGALSSDNSGEASATTSSIPLPVAPSNLAIASLAVEVVSLSWEDNSDVESGFKIQRKVGDGSFEDLISVNENVTYFNDTTVSEMQTYSYRVLAFNIGGDSEVSNEAEAVILFAAPQLLVGEAVTSTRIELTWNDVSSVETSYRVERKSGEADFEVIGTIGANSVLYSDAVAEPNTTYTYRVIAVQGEVESLPSNLVNVTTPNIPIPNSPTGLQIQALTETSISVSWTDNSVNEDGFRIYRREATNGVWIEIGDVVADVNLFVDNSALPGVSYSYRVSAYNGAGENDPAESDFRIPIAGRLINISTRGLVERGDNVMIGGFIIQGDGPKTVLIRGIGPSIAAVLNAPILNNPEVTLVSGIDLNNPIAYNDDWRDTDEAGIIASGLPPAFDNESALVIQLQPGAYSAILSGVDGDTGFGMIEVYEMDYAKNIRIVNISTRSFIQAGDKRMIGGFIITGDTPARVFIRVTGPSLPSIIENRLNDPVLELYSGPTKIISNDNWEDSDRIAEIVDSGIPPTNSNEPAIVATLEPGSYTAVVGGAGNTTGYGLLEIYDYPE
ncbi:MAG: fibronectin type III domain-containing protein [Verrucomicrobia bacterium]|nr:fibronectin type III domain-containing protein [Verrucomicrobiota bacterium]